MFTLILAETSGLQNPFLSMFVYRINYFCPSLLATGNLETVLMVFRSCPCADCALALRGCSVLWFG